MAIILSHSKWVNDVVILSGETVPVSSQNTKMSHGVEMPKIGSGMQKNNENQLEVTRDQVPSLSIMVLDFRLRMGMWV